MEGQLDAGGAQVRLKQVLPAGGTPGTTYRAIVRAALGDEPGTFSHLTHVDDSELCQAISTAKNPHCARPGPRSKPGAH